MSKQSLAGVIFVSREEEIKELQTHLEWVKKNYKPRLIFIHGEAGSGKTTLVEHFLEISQGENELLIGRGLCSLERQGSGLVPFATLLESLNKQVINWKTFGGNFAEFIGKVAPAWLDLVTFGFASPTAVTVEEGVKLLKSKRTGFSLDHVSIQFTNAIYQIAQERLTILFIEDLQWADKSSLELLFHLMRNLEDCPLLLLATYRTVEAMQTSEHAPEFRTIRANLIKDSNKGQELTILRGLDVRDYIQKRYKSSQFLADEFIARIQDETEGHAIYVAELFNLWEQTGVIVQEGQFWKLADPDATIAIPPGFQEVLQQRIENLSDQLRAIITRASVEGEDFTVQTIAKLLAIEESQIFDEIGVLEKNYHLVQQKGYEKISQVIFDFYRFAHRFIQQHIYDGLQPGQRRMLHRQIGLCLEELCEDTYPVAGQLARHFRLAGLPEQAIQYTIQAAEHEQNRYMWAEAQQWCMFGLEWLKDLPTQTETTLLHFNLLKQLGDSYYYPAEYQQSEKYYKKAIELTSKAEMDPEAIGQIYTNLADICDDTDRFEEGLLFVAQGKEYLSQHKSESGEAIFALMGLEGLLLGRIGKHSEACQVFEEALTTLETMSLTDSLTQIQGWIYHSQGIVISYLNEYEKAVDSYAKAYEIGKQINDLQLQSFALSCLADDSVANEDLEKASSAATQSIEIAQRIGDMSGESYGLYTRGLVKYSLGQLSESIQDFEKAIYLAQKIGSVPYYYYADAALAYQLDPDLSTAIAYANKGCIAARNSRKSAQAYAMNVLGLIESAKGNSETAVQCFEQALKLHAEDDQEGHHYLARTQKAYGEALLKMGENQKARGLLQEALRTFEALGLQNEIIQTRTMLEKVK